jgi:hypothetical protein
MDSTDDDLTSRINALAEEEHQLYELAGEHGGPDGAARERLVELRAELDQLWDLRRQREARAAAGQNPDEAQPREPATVRQYLQ